MAFEIVDIPAGLGGRGRFAEVISQLFSLPEGKCLKLSLLDSKDESTLRAAASWQGIRISIRSTPDASYVWVKDAKAGKPDCFENRKKSSGGAL